MKILFSSTLFDYWGGSEELWVRTALVLQQQGHKILLSLYPQKCYHPKIETLLNNGAKLLKWGSPTGKESLKDKILFKLYHKLNNDFIVKTVLNEEPEVIVLSQGDTFEGIINDHFYRLFQQTKAKTYIIAQLNLEHGPLEYTYIKRAREVFKKSERVFFVSNRNKTVAERQIAQKITNSIVVDNPININSTEYIPYPVSHKAILASVARFDIRFKAQDLLFQVLASKKWERRDWELNLYGDGKDKQYIEDLIEFYQLSDKVNIKGHVSDIRELWTSNQLLVLCSIAEGKPLALQEAMFCGRTAVVTDVAGNSELVTDNETGFLADAPCVNSVGAALERAWLEKDNWEKIGKLAHKWAMKNISTTPEIEMAKLITA